MQTKTYTAWCNMKARCNNPKASGYKNYGGRGIKVSPRWDKFANFIADMGECPEGMTIERNDVNADYSPENCRWIPALEQNHNKRTTLWVELLGGILSARKASELLNIPYERVRWAVERYGNDWLEYAKSGNAGKIQSNNTSGYRGVSYHKGSSRYHARIQIDGKVKSIGYFGTAEEAALARADIVAEIGKGMK